MKKLLAVLAVCTMLFCLAACSSGETLDEGSRQPNQSGEAGSESAGSEPEVPAANALVVYFSATGSTRAVAEVLAGMQGADLYEIMPEQPYTNEDLNYHDNSSRTTVEQNDKTVRPAISGSVDHIEDYDVIYVGFPIWWGDMPRILYTFFDTYDLSGKTIAPFCTSGSSGISQAVQSMRELEPSAGVTDGLRASTSNTENDLMEWLSSIGLAE